MHVLLYAIRGSVTSSANGLQSDFSKRVGGCYRLTSMRVFALIRLQSKWVNIEVMQMDEAKRSRLAQQGT